MDSNEFVEKILFKNDEKTGELRVSKVKGLTFLFFIIGIMSGFNEYIGTHDPGIFVIAALKTGIFYAIIVYIVGWIISKISKSGTNKNIQQNKAQVTTNPATTTIPQSSTAAIGSTTGSTSDSTVSTTDLNTNIPSSAVACDWAVNSKWIPAIKKTWNVDVKPYRISKEDADHLEGRSPRNLKTDVKTEDFVSETSSNSIFWHQKESWVEYGYAKFLYKGKIHYVNVSPTLPLTETMYNRNGDLNNMAKILLTIAQDCGSDRETLLVVLEGELKDN